MYIGEHFKVGHKSGLSLRLLQMYILAQNQRHNAKTANILAVANQLPAIDISASVD